MVGSLDRFLQVLVFAQALVAAACSGARIALPPRDGAARLLVVGDVVLATSRGSGRDDIGGLSGAYYDPSTRRLYAVSDDRDRPRLVLLDVALRPRLTLIRRSVTPLELPHPTRRTLDAEGIAPGPRGRIFIASEGNAADPGEPAPGIYEYTRSGRFVRALPVPRWYLGGGRSGMRDNGAFEGLSASPNGRRLFAAVESSLRQDGEPATLEHGAVTRLLVYDIPIRGSAPREFAYEIERVQRPPSFLNPAGENGVAEILALSETDLLVLERAFVRERGVGAARTANTIRLFQVRLDSRSEITGRGSLADGPPAVPLAKRLILDAAAVAPELSEPLRALENFEAMTFGPRLPDGRSSLLLISDDNFSDRQVTAGVLLAFGR